MVRSLYYELNLPWLVQIVAVELKIFPKFLFLFQSLLVHLPYSLLSSIQTAINKFIWGYKKSRIKLQILPKNVNNGSLDIPNVILYYLAIIHLAIMQWWQVEYTHDNWQMEQRDIPVPLQVQKFIGENKHIILNCNNEIYRQPHSNPIALTVGLLHQEVLIP